eukprot:57791_1
MFSCMCHACYEGYDTYSKEEINERAKRRRQALKKGQHWQDSLAECNLTEFDGSTKAIFESRSEFQEHDLTPIINMMVEFAIGKRGDHDDRCEYCLNNKGHEFFPNHPNPKKSCYSCKCNHISMFTEKQAIKKFPKLTSSAFYSLRHENKSVKILRSAKYRIRDEYFLIDDIEKKCIELFGSIKGAKNSRKKRKTQTKPKAKKRKVNEMNEDVDDSSNSRPKKKAKKM